MQMFAPNVMVIGDTLYSGAGDAVGKPNPPQAARQYETEIMNLRTEILSRPFGAKWLEIIGNNKEPITLVPSEETTNSRNETFPNIPQHPNRMREAVAAGFTTPAGVTGTGAGTPSRIKFNSGASAGMANGSVLLVHELTHAYRSSGGRFSPAAMTGLVNPERQKADPELEQRFPNWEEFLAVVVENVFAAELGKNILRINWNVLHPGFATSPSFFTFWQIKPPAGDTDSMKFAKDYSPAILRIMQIESPLYGAMRASTAWFNPVRDYEKYLPLYL
jgi:hypothetical protein